MRSVALVGPDGTGKSSVAKRLVQELPVPARRVYMGVNLASSTAMLPTTRLALALKRRRGGRADMTAGLTRTDAGMSRRRRFARAAYSALRLAAWTAEEWYRVVLAWRYRRQGYLVIFDRHFFYDYYASDVDNRRGRSMASRVHGLMLRRFYPRPDLVVFLDAPADVLQARKNEHSLDALERRRQEYMRLLATTPNMVVVDSTQPLEAVVSQVAGMVAPAR